MTATEQTTAPKPSVITTILGGLASIIAGWQAPTNVESDIADGLLVLTQAENVDPELAIGGTILKYVESGSTSYANLVGGQAALVATVGATFDGTADKVVIVAMRQSSDVAKQILGL